MFVITKNRYNRVRYKRGLLYIYYVYGCELMHCMLILMHACSTMIICTPAVFWLVLCFTTSSLELQMSFTVILPTIWWNDNIVNFIIKCVFIKNEYSMYFKIWNDLIIWNQRLCSILCHSLKLRNVFNVYFENTDLKLKTKSISAVKPSL